VGALCNHGLIQNWPANLTGAAVVTAPSLAAAAVALPVLLRRRPGQPRTAALVATIGVLAFIVYVFAATVHDLLHSGPYPCG
jgi:hypothetical protein